MLKSKPYSADFAPIRNKSAVYFKHSKSEGFEKDDILDDLNQVKKAKEADESWRVSIEKAIREAWELPEPTSTGEEEDSE